MPGHIAGAFKLELRLGFEQDAFSLLVPHTRRLDPGIMHLRSAVGIRGNPARYLGSVDVQIFRDLRHRHAVFDEIAEFLEPEIVERLTGFSSWTGSHPWKL